MSQKRGRNPMMNITQWPLRIDMIPRVTTRAR